MMNIVTVRDLRSGKFDDFPCEDEDIDECVEWLANKLAYEIVMRESIEESAATAAGLPFRTIMNRVAERKKDFKVAIFDAPEDDPDFDKEKYSDGKYHPEEEIPIEWPPKD